MMGGDFGKVVDIASFGTLSAAKKATGIDKLEKQKRELKTQEAAAAASETARKAKAADKLKRKKQFQETLTASGGAIDVGTANVKTGELFGR